MILCGGYHKMIFSSLTHPLPKPSPRYKRIAQALRSAGLDVNNRDFELIDSLVDAVKTKKVTIVMERRRTPKK
jgi:hypothetical protein